MKMLRNPWVSGTLAVGAAGLVYYQSFAGRFQRAVLAEEPKSSAPTAKETRPVQAAEAPPRKIDEVDQSAVDRSYVQAHLAEWLDAPQRDPFLLESEVSQKATTQKPSPVLEWQLKAIWRQTDGRVAVINGRVYAEGDMVQGCRVLRIESEQVWMDGPGGKERLCLQLGHH